MARILCVTPPLVGILHVVLEMARRLEEDGHELLLCVPESMEPTVRSYGREPLRLPAERALEEFLTADAESSLARRWRNIPQRLTEAVRRSQVLTWAEEIRALEPDLVLLDAELLEQIAVLAGHGLRVAQLNGFGSVWRRPGLTPTHRNVRPGHGLAGSRPGRWALWQELIWRKRLRALRLRVSQAGVDRLSRLRALSAASGFDFERHADDTHWLRPLAFSRLPVVNPRAQEFDFPHEPLDTVHYVGPQVPVDRPGSVSDDDRRTLEEVYARRQDGDRLIYATFGSFFTADSKGIDSMVRALRPGWRLLLTGGGAAESLGEGLPDAVHVVSWAPQLEVLRHTDVAIVHGGIHTVDECVLAGVPQLVANGWKTDMAGNTARIVHHGLGLEMRPGDGPDQIGAKLDRLLGEESFRNTAQRFGDAYRAYAERGDLERVVRDLLDREPLSGAVS